MPLDDLIIDLYHEILMNEVGVMRGNYPVIQGIRIGNAIYYITHFVGKTTVSTPRRGLDFATLAYAIINGLRRRYCGYDPEKPSYWRKKCGCIKAIYDGLLNDLGKRPSNLKDLLVTVVLTLMKPGLIKPIPATGIAESTVTPTRFISAANTKHVSVRGDVELISLAIADLLNRFFTANCPGLSAWNPRHVIDAEEEILKQVGVYGIMKKAGMRVYYKTAHGELLRALANASSLPWRLANFEARVLPFLAEPPPPNAGSATIPKTPVDKLRDPLIDFLSSHGITHAERVADAIIKGVKNAGYTHLNPYQATYLELVLKKGLNNTLVALTSPTGSGKTLVFILIAVVAALAGKLSRRPQRAIITYPRKSLAREQLERLIELLRSINEELAKLNNLLGRDPRIKIAIRDGDSMKKATPGQPTPLREITVNGPKGRKLVLCHWIGTGGAYEAELREGNCNGLPVEKIDWVFDTKEEVTVKGGAKVNVLHGVLNNIDIVITNNSMLSKLGFDMASQSVPEWLDWLSHLKLIVIDEAHVFMNPSEMEKMFLTLTRLLWIASMRYGNVTINDYAKMTGLSIILSSATLTESDLFRTPSAPIHTQNIIGVMRSPTCRTGGTGVPKEIKEFIKKLLGNKLYSALAQNLIYRDYYTTVTCSGGNDPGAVRGLLKLNIYAVTLPSPLKSSWTSLAESMIAVLHWINYLRTKAGLRSAGAIVFIDNKETQRHILKVFAERQVIDAVDHADRVLMSVLYPRSLLNPTKDRDGYKLIWDKELKALSGLSLFEAAWDIGRSGNMFSNFHALGIYHSMPVIRAMTSVRITSNETAMSQALRASFPDITGFIEGLIDYAKLFLNHAGTRKPLTVVEKALKKGVPVGFVIHNADLDKRHRMKLERYLRNGVPYLIMTTSTLEVGIDIPTTTLVLQYASTPTTAELIQRFGRSGRGSESLYVTIGVIVLRNTGEDVQYLKDEDAVNYVFGLRFPALPNTDSNIDALVRNVVSVAIHSGGVVSPNQVRSKVKDYLSFLGINDQITVLLAEELASNAVGDVMKIRQAMSGGVHSVHGGSHRGLGSAIGNSIKDLNNAINDLLTDYLYRVQNNPVLVRYHHGIQARRLIGEYVNKIRPHTGSPHPNLSFILYLVEETRDLISELAPLATIAQNPTVKGVIKDVIRDAVEILNTAEDVLALFMRSYVDSSAVSGNSDIVDSFIYRLIRPGVLEKIGGVKETYGNPRYVPGGPPKPEVLGSFDELLRRASPAKHKGG